MKEAKHSVLYKVTKFRVRRISGIKCPKPADGNTPWQIAHNLPEPWSPFSVAKWNAALVYHPDNPFVEALLCDITHGVELNW